MTTIKEGQPDDRQIAWVWLEEEWKIAAFNVKLDGKLEWLLLWAECMTALPEHLWTPAHPPVPVVKGH